MRNLTKAAMARQMQTSRSSCARLLDPENSSVTLHTLHRALPFSGSGCGWSWSSCISSKQEHERNKREAAQMSDRLTRNIHYRKTTSLASACTKEDAAYRWLRASLSDGTEAY